METQPLLPRTSLKTSNLSALEVPELVREILWFMEVTEAIKFMSVSKTFYRIVRHESYRNHILKDLYLNQDRVRKYFGVLYTPIFVEHVDGIEMDNFPTSISEVMMILYMRKVLMRDYEKSARDWWWCIPMIFCFICPPLAVIFGYVYVLNFEETRCDGHEFFGIFNCLLYFYVCCVLTMLGFFPGVLFALFVILSIHVHYYYFFKERPKRVVPKDGLTNGDEIDDEIFDDKNYDETLMGLLWILCPCCFPSCWLYCILCLCFDYVCLRCCVRCCFEYMAKRGNFDRQNYVNTVIGRVHSQAKDLARDVRKLIKTNFDAPKYHHPKYWSVLQDWKQDDVMADDVYIV